MILKILGGSSELITFTINTTEYQAEEDMTWEEFINSEYNIPKSTQSELYIYNGYVCATTSTIQTMVYDTQNNPQYSTQTIQNGANYITSLGGGGSD